MERLMGNKVDIHLKFNDVVSGVLFDTDDENVYIQNDSNLIVGIPKDNIKYYVSGIAQPTGQAQPVAVPSSGSTNVLKVSIDGVLVVEIPVSSELNMASCSEQLLQLVWGNETVKAALEGKVQRSLEYDVGMVNIITIDGSTVTGGTNYVHNSQGEDSDVTFSMGGESSMHNPIDMATIISKGGKK